MSRVSRIGDKVADVINAVLPGPPVASVPPDIDGRREGDLDLRRASITAQLAAKGSVVGSGTVIGGEPMPEPPRD